MVIVALIVELCLTPVAVVRTSVRTPTAETESVRDVTILQTHSRIALHRTIHATFYST